MNLRLIKFNYVLRHFVVMGNSKYHSRYPNVPHLGRLRKDTKDSHFKCHFSGYSAVQSSAVQLLHDVLTLHLHPVGQRVAFDVTRDESDVDISRKPPPVRRHRQRGQRAGSPV